MLAKRVFETIVFETIAISSALRQHSVQLACLCGLVASLGCSEPRNMPINGERGAGGTGGGGAGGGGSGGAKDGSAGSPGSGGEPSDAPGGATTGETNSPDNDAGGAALACNAGASRCAPTLRLWC